MKYLYSPQYGTGWTSVNREEYAFDFLTYEPIVTFIEDGNKFTGYKWMDKPPFFSCDEPGHSLLLQFRNFLIEKYKLKEDTYFNFAGAVHLAIQDWHGPVQIEEYDGYERINYLSWIKD